MLVANQKIQVHVWAIFLCGIMILKKMLAETLFMVVAMEITTDLQIWRNVKPSVIQTVQSILGEVKHLTVKKKLHFSLGYIIEFIFYHLFVKLKNIGTLT